MAAGPMSVCPPAPGGAAVGSLRGFSAIASGAITPVQEAAIATVLDMLITQGTKDEITGLFDGFDIDHNGSIEWADLVVLAAGDASAASTQYSAKFQWLLSTFDSKGVGADGDGTVTREEFYQRFRLQAKSVLIGRCAAEINRSIVEKSHFVSKLMQADASVAKGKNTENTPLLRFFHGNSLPVALAHAMIAVIPDPIGIDRNVPAGTDATMTSDADTIAAHEEKVLESLQKSAAGPTLREYLNDHASARRASDGSTYTKADVTKFLLAIEACDFDL